MKIPKGKMAPYRRKEDGMLVDVDVFEEGGRLYTRMWNDKAVIVVGRETCDCGEEKTTNTVPASPWCLEISQFGAHYEPVAPLPKLGACDARTHQ